MRREHVVPGRRVRLPANKQEGWPEEFGTVMVDDDRRDMLLVLVDKQYRDKNDDGRREVLLSQVELLP